MRSLAHDGRAPFPWKGVFAEPLVAKTNETKAAPVASIFQTDGVALRVRMDTTWALRAANVIAWVQNVTW